MDLGIKDKSLKLQKEINRKKLTPDSAKLDHTGLKPEVILNNVLIQVLK